MRANLLARLVGAGGETEPRQRFFCDAPPGAGGRGPLAKEGAAQMDRHGPSYRESVLGRGWAQFRRRSRVGKALRKPRFPQGMGS